LQKEHGDNSKNNWFLEGTQCGLFQAPKSLEKFRMVGPKPYRTGRNEATVEKIQVKRDLSMLKSPQSAKKLGEILAVILVIAGINRLGSFEAGFGSFPVNPYTFFSIFAAVWFGRLYGFAAFLLSLLSLALPFPQQRWPESVFQLYAHFKVPFLWALVGVYLFGMVHTYFTAQLETKNKYLRKAASEKFRLDTEVKALVEVNRDLEERVLRQQESVTSLFSRIKDLSSQNLAETLAALLDMVGQYAWASKASVWINRPEENVLERYATLGWQEEDLALQKLPVTESIEGWVVRNNLVFSARMLVNYANLRKMDRGRNIMAFPISFGKVVWGVLNIEEMPFSKFNLYTEKILGALIDLGSPSIEKTVANERLMVTALHPQTGFPLISVLQKKMEQWVSSLEYKGSSFSIIILELVNFDSILSSFGDKKTYGLIKRYMGEIKTLSGNVGEVYHYQKESQMVLFYPQIDYDGTALFCFDLLGMINGKTWQIDEKVVPMDMLIGFANSGKGKIEGDSILRAAEEVLEKQKR
jgi:GGDEF domain-containing protein